MVVRETDAADTGFAFETVRSYGGDNTISLVSERIIPRIEAGASYSMSHTVRVRKPLTIPAPMPTSLATAGWKQGMSLTPSILGERGAWTSTETVRPWRRAGSISTLRTASRACRLSTYRLRLIPCASAVT